MAVQAMLAGGHVELPAVPRTGHDAARKCTFAQWASLMRAHSIQRVEDTLDVVERNDPLANHELTRCARRAINDGCDTSPHTVQTSKAVQAPLLPGDALARDRHVSVEHLAAVAAAEDEELHRVELAEVRPVENVVHVLRRDGFPLVHA